MSDLRELARQAYCDYIAQMKRPECLGVYAKLKDGTFGKAELEGHVRAGELLGRHRALAEAAALASQPTDLKATAACVIGKHGDCKGNDGKCQCECHRKEVQPSGPKETSVGDLKAKLEALRKRAKKALKDIEHDVSMAISASVSTSRYNEGRADTLAKFEEELTAIIEGKD